MTIDGVEEQDFRAEIEDMLRLDEVDAAIQRLRALIEPYARPGGILPPRILDVSVEDISVTGWDRLANRLANHDRPNQPISAIGVALSDARVLGGPGPANGKLAPFVKTFYFADDAYPFSDATRSDLLDGYTREGFGWHGDYRASDATLSIKGLDDLYGAVVELEDRLFDMPDAAEDEFRAGAIGACYLTVLIHKALRDAIRQRGLPRPLCVIAACDGVYPFFDAPVVGQDECLGDVTGQTAGPEDGAMDFEDEPLGNAAFDNEAEDLAEPTAGASLLSISLRKTTKTPVLVVLDEDANEAARLYQAAAAEYVGAAASAVEEQPLLGSHAPHPHGPDADHALAEADRLAAMIHVSHPEPVLAEAEDTFEPEPEAEPGSTLVEADAESKPEDIAPEPIADEVAEISEPEPEPEPYVTPQAVATGHALRSRLQIARPVAPVESRGSLATLLDRFKRWLTSLRNNRAD